ncbi:MAG: fructose-1,6-bisphosphatase [Salinivirgaceae bacterium]|nr:fructose-1,6-bisphosphatase [Salinivirgaceae bacterium]
MAFSEQEIKYLKLLSKKYPSIQKASTEIINLKAILSLPKGTEHFMSDIHGEYEAFTHIVNSASGVIKRRIGEIFKDTLRDAEKDGLATLIYYPNEKIRLVLKKETAIEEWYKITLHRLTKVCRSVSSKYTRSKVRKSLPKDFAYVIEELLHVDENQLNKQQYYDGIMETIISTGRAKEFIVELSALIRRLVIDRLHIVGDIFDRGPHPDLIIEELLKYDGVDVQWGNHDMVWMGAAMGSQPLIATLIRIAARYDNLSTVEDAYGINLLPLATFAMQVYKNDPCAAFKPKLTGDHSYNEDEIYMVQQMQKAIAIIQFKLEGQLIKRRPEFKMDDRLLLEQIDFEKYTIKIGRKTYQLNDTNFPTIDPQDPYTLTDQEKEVMDRLAKSFLRSHKLQRHLKFLLNKGGMYKVFNSNLMYHGCIPMTPEGEFKRVKIEGTFYSGKPLLDKYDEIIRQCYYYKQNTGDDSVGLDYVYYLWPGPDSSLFGKTKMATFERYFINDKETHAEEKNPYFTLRDQEELSIKVLNEFNMDADHSHIVNGHVPVKLKKGENPVKGKGKMIVIDGGLAKAYQPVTGIAGYTLIYNSYGLMLAAHEPFESKQKAIEEERDIVTDLSLLEKTSVRKRVGDTDVGIRLKEEIEELEQLLVAFRKGYIREVNEIK